MASYRLKGRVILATHTIGYDHLGLGNPVIVDYADANLRLDRFIDPAHMGSGVTSGEYAGMDQYGRLTRQVWAASSWDPDLAPAVIDVAYHYDVNSDITQRYDAREGTSLADQGDEYTYDGLHRLTGATRGKPVSGWTADGTRAEDWDLDVFGNWNSYDNSIGSDLVEETRDHNQANELIENSRSINSGTAVDLDSTYDDAGNLRTRMVDAEVRWVYTWDAWNRLVAVDIEEFKAGDWYSLAPRLESSYYGLNQRAWSRLDAGAAGYTNNGVPTNVLDRMELFYYDASWRLLERRADESWNGTSFVHDSTSQWVWGQRYIDELVASITDGDLNDEFEDLFYAMTDRNFSVIGLSQSTGSSGERIRYDAYGQAQAMPLGDADHNGAVDLDDQNIVLSNFGADIGDTGSPLYRVEADFNSDGAIDLDDLGTVLSNFGTSIDRGRLSASGNIVGYAGYIFEPATGIYVSRHRWYSTENGRWLSRDPLGYMDGNSLYGYGSPLVEVDPMGTAPVLPKCSGRTKKEGGKCYFRTSRPNPAHRPSSNGCGGAGGPQFPEIFDFGGNIVNFGPACDSHDRCYATCGADRARCDRTFYEDLVAACNRWSMNWWNTFRCMTYARAYYRGVRLGGNGPYQAAQDIACLWDECCCN